MLNVCFSCRIEQETPYQLDGEDICGACGAKWMEHRSGTKEDIRFPAWRVKVAEGFGFDPYLERDASIQMYAARSAALIPISAETLELLDELREMTPGAETDDILQASLKNLLRRIDEKVAETDQQRMMAQLIGISVAQALRAGGFEEGE